MTFIEKLYKIFVKEKRYNLIINGLENTLIITFFACAFGCIIGILICYLRTQNNKIINNIAKYYIYFFRGIPIVLLIMLMYYIVLANTRLSGVSVSIITFSLYHSAFIAEVFRSGLLAVKKEQIEASVSLGFNKAQTFFYIILPQVVRIIFPVYKGEIITLIKLTSVVGYIGVRDLTRAIDIIRSQTFDAIFPIIIAIIIYFILIGIINLILDFIERKINPRKDKKYDKSF